MNLYFKIAVLTFGALFIAPLAGARECPTPPVRNSQQAACFAAAYAEKNGLSHRAPLRRKVSKGRDLWTVRFVDSRPDARGRGWEVDVDAASGTVTRFRGYKERER